MKTGKLDTRTSWTGPMQVITLFVKNKEESRKYYTRVFGFRIFYEDADSIVFEMSNLLLNFLNESAAPEVVSPAPVGSHACGTRMLFTVHVADVDARCAQLKAAGIPILLDPVDRPWGVRTANLADPDGYIWEIACPIHSAETP